MIIAKIIEINININNEKKKGYDYVFLFDKMGIRDITSNLINIKTIIVPYFILNLLNA